MPVLLKENQTTIWFSTPPTIHPLFSGNLCKKKFEEKTDSVNAMTECMTGFNNFYMETIMPKKTVWHFLRNMSCITSDLKGADHKDESL